MEEPIANESPIESSQETKRIETAPDAFAALRYRSFQLYFGGQLISNIGTWMQTIAQGWLVYQLTHSDLALGIVGFAAAVPALVISPWAGAVVDRVPKRRLLITTQASAMMLAFILAALTFTGAVREWHIILLAGGLGLVNSFDSPGGQAFVVEMVGRQDMPNAIALNSLMINSARVVGPALGGILLALVGTAWCFTINGISFLAVLVGLSIMEVKPPTRLRTIGSSWRQLTEGLHYVFKRREMGGLLLISLIFSTFGVSYATLLPAFVEQVLHQGAASYGWVNAAIGAGAVTGAIIVANQHGRSWRGSWLMISGIAFPILLSIFAFTPFLAVCLILALGLGIGFMIQYTMINTILQTRVEDQLRGRVMALYTLTFLGFTPLGNLAIGALAQTIGLGDSILIFAVLSLALTLVVLRKIPQIKELP
ncbi:MAG TPA: MFS transporter [Anaerolineales bacterium]|nr:MFS transporter [Anaerolineales bacterium]